MTATSHALWFTQMIEFEVPGKFQQALAQALVARSEELAARCEGLQGVSIQASDDGSRVLQYLQWQSRQAWAAAAVYFVGEPSSTCLASTRRVASTLLPTRRCAAWCAVPMAACIARWVSLRHTRARSAGSDPGGRQ